MADSVREQIMKHVQATLEGITVENGYANTLRSVQRFRQDGQELANLPAAILIEGGDDVDLNGPLELTSRTMTVSVVLIQQQDTDVDAQSASELMNSLIADVQRAMQVDHRRGGVAIDTTESGIGDMNVDEGQPELVQTIGYRIAYRHLRNDPTEAA
mgnify:CR=1 FL=1